MENSFFKEDLIIDQEESSHTIGFKWAIMNINLVPKWLLEHFCCQINGFSVFVNE